MQSDASLVVQRELGPQERLLWSGKPRAGLVLRSSDAFLIPFSLLWGGFAFFWEYSVLSGNAPVFFALWGIPFVIAGCHMIFGRFVLDMKQRETTAYAVTSERIIIITGLFRRGVKSLNLRTLTDISLSERSDGSGTITFGSGYRYSWWFQGIGWWPGMPAPTPAFELVPRAKEIYETIRTAQRSAT
jgi:hypothetical protein